MAGPSAAGLPTRDAALSKLRALRKRYRCEFNRDTGWDVLGQLGYEGVRQVAIDEDWSALRFRRVEFVKTMIRDPQRAMTDQGKARVTKK